jgi:hypothetical protein
MRHGLPVEPINAGHDAILEFLFGFDVDMTQHRTRELGEVALDENRAWA